MTDHPITPPPELAISSDYDILSQLTDEELKKGQDMLSVPWQAEDIVVKKSSMGDRSLLPHRPPLWEEIDQAWWRSRAVASDQAASVIRALRDWLKGELPEGGAWYVLLTTEAERAERGDD